MNAGDGGHVERLPGALVRSARDDPVSWTLRMGASVTPKSESNAPNKTFNFELQFKNTGTPRFSCPGGLKHLKLEAEQTNHANTEGYDPFTFGFKLA